MWGRDTTKIKCKINITTISTTNMIKTISTIRTTIRTRRMLHLTPKGVTIKTSTDQPQVQLAAALSNIHSKILILTYSGRAKRFRVEYLIIVWLNKRQREASYDEIS